ncbi:MAG: CarD family transcriptional regulator [Anaerolineae bacterium]
MQFKVGDAVVHPIYGIGHIATTEERAFSKQESRLYYHVVLPKRDIWIAVETQEASGLRLVTAKSELDRYRTLLKSRPAPLHKNHHHRHLEIANRLKQGSFQAICEVVRDLTAWGWRKPLGPTDSATLHKVRNSLYREWASAAGISTVEAIREIDSLMVATQQAFAE